MENGTFVVQTVNSGEERTRRAPFGVWHLLLGSESNFAIWGTVNKELCCIGVANKATNIEGRHYGTLTFAKCVCFVIQSTQFFSYFFAKLG